MGLRAAVIPERGVLRADLDHHRPARRPPDGSSADASTTLHGYVAAGTPVIGLEPSCLAALREDAGQLVDDPRVAEVSGGVRSLAEFLADRVGRASGRRRTSPASRSWPSRTATTTP